MGQLALLNFAITKKKGETDQIWLFYVLPSQSYVHSAATESYCISRLVDVEN